MDSRPDLQSFRGGLGGLATRLRQDVLPALPIDTPVIRATFPDTRAGGFLTLALFRVIAVGDNYWLVQTGQPSVTPGVTNGRVDVEVAVATNARSRGEVQLVADERSASKAPSLFVPN